MVCQPTMAPCPVAQCIHVPPPPTYTARHVTSQLPCASSCYTLQAPSMQTLCMLPLPSILQLNLFLAVLKCKFAVAQEKFAEAQRQKRRERREKRRRDKERRARAKGDLAALAALQAEEDNEDYGLPKSTISKVVSAIRRWVVSVAGPGGHKHRSLLTTHLLAMMHGEVGPNAAMPHDGNSGQYAQSEHALEHEHEHSHAGNASAGHAGNVSAGGAEGAWTGDAANHSGNFSAGTASMKGGPHGQVLTRCESTGSHGSHGSHGSATTTMTRATDATEDAWAYAEATLSLEVCDCTASCSCNAAHSALLDSSQSQGFLCW